jgi:hypothetical protein
MKTILLIGIFWGNISLGSAQKSQGVDYYVSPYKSDHSECSPLSYDIAECPDNKLNVGLTPSQEMDKDIEMWAVILRDCNEESSAVSVCP